MVSPLMVAVDGSPSSLEAVDWAADEAARQDVPLRIVHGVVQANRPEPQEDEALPFAPPQTREQAVEEGDEVVAAAAERVRRRAPGVKVTAEVLPGEAVNALLGESAGALALVLGHRGRGALTGLLLGSVGLEVAGRAECPVVIIRGEKSNIAGEFGRVVLGVRETDDAPAAAEFAFREAEARNCELHAVHAWHLQSGQDEAMKDGIPCGPMMFAAKEHLEETLKGPAARHPGVKVISQEAYCGSARDGLLRAAASADLLVVGSRRLQRAFGLQLGPVSHGALHHAPCPVAIIPQPS
ncbi:universal stress protein [Streptomyces sp. NPDC087420]|uniref:universal stress protein n=1 Tax=Streptomyces sp. NPDC087420 TaxID=3365785 RepID=UPI0038363034